jgi:hypothetical protein
MATETMNYFRSILEGGTIAARYPKHGFLPSPRVRQQLLHDIREIGQGRVPIHLSNTYVPFFRNEGQIYTGEHEPTIAEEFHGTGAEVVPTPEYMGEEWVRRFPRYNVAPYIYSPQHERTMRREHLLPGHHNIIPTAPAAHLRDGLANPMIHDRRDQHGTYYQYGDNGPKYYYASPATAAVAYQRADQPHGVPPIALHHAPVSVRRAFVFPPDERYFRYFK